MGISLLNAEYVTQLYSGKDFRKILPHNEFIRNRQRLIADDLHSIGLDNKQFNRLAKKYGVHIATIHDHARKLRKTL